MVSADADHAEDAGGGQPEGCRFRSSGGRSSDFEVRGIQRRAAHLVVDVIDSEDVGARPAAACGRCDRVELRAWRIAGIRPVRDGRQRQRTVRIAVRAGAAVGIGVVAAELRDPPVLIDQVDAGPGVHRERARGVVQIPFPGHFGEEDAVGVERVIDQNLHRRNDRMVAGVAGQLKHAHADAVQVRQ
ncbi:MAG: hypothetical protein JWO40_849 [Candidatus Doudnabacteria bacterium]|nr:hypothetical protein [Candidatus Doudnabacteria bacterium]